MSRVLIVDPDSAVLAAFRRFFADLPVEMVCVPSLEEGIHGAGGVADLILIDELSGGIDRERAAVIRDRNFSMLTPVIGMSATRLSKEQWQALGYSAFLQKPLNAAQVRESLTRWLPSVAKSAAVKESERVSGAR